MKTILQSLGILILLTIVWSCEGPEGPEGPQGLQGNKGVDGSPGSSGTNGKDGNANVTCYTYNITYNDWKTSAKNSLYYLCDAQFVTSGIVTTGLVKVFMNRGNNDTVWYALPYTFTYSDNPSHFEIITYNYWPTVVEIFEYSNDGTTPTPIYDRDYKVVAVAGTLVSINPEIKWYNYTELKNAYPAIDKSIISK